MTESASEHDFGITPALCDIWNHPCAEAFLEWTLRTQGLIVRPRRILADAVQRCVESIEYVAPDQMQKFKARIAREPFGFQIFVKIISDENEMVAMVDCADLLAKFESKFPA